MLITTGQPTAVYKPQMQHCLPLKQQFTVTSSLLPILKNNNLSGNLTVSYRPNTNLNVYGTFSTAYKPVGVNVGGLPTTSTGEADLFTCCG